MHSPPSSPPPHTHSTHCCCWSSCFSTFCRPTTSELLLTGLLSCLRHSLPVRALGFRESVGSLFSSPALSKTESSLEMACSVVTTLLVGLVSLEDRVGSTFRPCLGDVLCLVLGDGVSAKERDMVVCASAARGDFHSFSFLSATEDSPIMQEQDCS